MLKNGRLYVELLLSKCFSRLSYRLKNERLYNELLLFKWRLHTLVRQSSEAAMLQQTEVALLLSELLLSMGYHSLSYMLKNVRL